MPVFTTGEQSVKPAYHCATLLDNWDEDRRQFGVPPSTIGDTGKLDADTTYHTSYQPLSATQVADAKPPGCFAAEAPRMLLFHHGDIGNIETYCYATSELAHTDRKKEIYTNDEVLDMPGVSSRCSRSVALQRSTMGFAPRRRGSSLTPMNDLHPEEVSAALLRETNYLHSMASTVRSAPNSASQTQTSPHYSGSEKVATANEQSDYSPPRLLPLGRVAERDRLLTTKNVTLDATGIHLFDNLGAYPLTSSDCAGELTNWCDNPMYKTNLRIHYMEDDY
ncbi:hypothetical protein JKF63_01752 [Porcisia hertigi]|uniref:Uncharacterized protein n=1 Tax=Porcisia hertigi TaxID=2761500 RepID=A0A836HZZ6_9TRYP|nr:hypothetical protein JKF63_01752 [Porcisia hertigi]